MEPPLKKLKTNELETPLQPQTQSILQDVKTTTGTQPDETQFGITEFFGAHNFAISGILKER